MGERVPRVGDDGSVVGLALRLVEVRGVDLRAVVLPRQRSDSSDRACCLASHLGGLLVGLLVLDVLEDDDLETNDTGLQRDDESASPGHASEKGRTAMVNGKQAIPTRASFQPYDSPIIEPTMRSEAHV